MIKLFVIVFDLALLAHLGDISYHRREVAHLLIDLQGVHALPLLEFGKTFGCPEVSSRCEASIRMLSTCHACLGLGECPACYEGDPSSGYCELCNGVKYCRACDGSGILDPNLNANIAYPNLDN